MEVIKKYLFPKSPLTKGSAVFILALLIFGALTPLKFADAGIFGEIIDFAAGSFTFLPAFLFLFALQLILTLSSFLALAAGLLLEGVISIPLFFTKCPDANPCFLDTAWSLMRDIVNMLLIIILVVIAFATMLRREELGARKALIPLIVVAVLVNFSRVIVGVVVDISSLVMGVFLPQITGVSALTDSLAAQKGIILDQLDASTFKISDQILAIFKTLTLIIFQMAYAFILALYAVIFLVRFVALWLLTIFSPIAFVAFILPITRKKIFDEWRNQLISWSFMGVTAVFFLWLGKLFSQSIGKYGETFSSGEVFSENTLLGEFLLEIFPYIFLLIFLYVTFMLALKTNAVGAGMMINAGKKLAGGATGAAKSWAAKNAAQTFGGAAQKQLEGLAGSRAARIPVLGGGIRAAAQFGSQKIREAERLKQARDGAVQMNDPMLTAQIKTEGNATKFKALMEEKIKRGDTKDIEKLLSTGQLSKGKMGAMVKNLSLRNQEKDILTAFPEYAHASRNVVLNAKHEEYRKDLITEGFSPEEAEKDAKNSQFVSTLPKEKAKQISDSSLADKNIIHGLQENKEIQLLDDLATSNRRMEKILEGFVAKHGGNEAEAMKELAQEIKVGNIKNAGALLGEETFRDALSMQTDKLTRGILLAVSNTAKSDELHDLIEKIHENNHSGFNKIYGDAQIKAIIKPELIAMHEKEGGAGGGRIVVPPPGASGEALRRLAGE